MEAEGPVNAERRLCVAGLALAVVALVTGACRGDEEPRWVAPASSPAVLPSFAGPGSAEDLVVYSGPCTQAVVLVGVWTSVADRAGQAADLSGVDRREVEQLIQAFAALQPRIPEDVQPYITTLVDGLVKVRGLLLLGRPGPVEFGPGREAARAVQAGCGPYVPR